jgi:hypothetical protein
MHPVLIDKILQLIP